jgi:hypothetical protein
VKVLFDSVIFHKNAGNWLNQRKEFVKDVKLPLDNYPETFKQDGLDKTG